jgi:hypothetical protein
MLDVADEMGFMIIDETAIRGSNGDQDFVEGLANMRAHADALVRRDRNHPPSFAGARRTRPSSTRRTRRRSSSSFIRRFRPPTTPGR